MRSISSLWAAATAALVLAACGGESTIDIQILSNDRCNGLNIIEPNDRVILTVSGPGMSSVSAESRGGSRGIEIPDIPEGKDRVARVQVCSATPANECDLRAVGESTPFEVREDGADSVRVVLYRTNFFSKVVAAGSGECSHLGSARAGHVAERLADGKVLLAGGFTSLDGDKNPTGFLRSTEIFDPTTGAFRAGPEMPAPRAQARSVRLKDGRILIVGGVHEEGGKTVPASGAFLFDGKGWTSVETAAARRGHSVTLVERSGHAVVIGGVDGDDQIVSTVEYFDSKTDSFHPVDLPQAGDAFARAWHVAANIGTTQSTIVIAGGVHPAGRISEDVSLLVWDGSVGRYAAQPKRFQMDTPTMRSSALLLGTAGDPRLAIAGGAVAYTAPPERPGAGTPTEPTNQVQYFEPSSKMSPGSAEMKGGRVFDSCAIAVDTTRGLVLGGTTGGRGPSDIGELLRLDGGELITAPAGGSTGSMQPRHHAACVDLGARGVLVTGGLDLREAVSNVAYNYIAKPNKGD